MPRLVLLLLVSLSVLSCTQQPPPVAPASSSAGQIPIDCDDGFDIKFKFVDPIPALYQRELERAEVRWESIITGDLPDIDFDYWTHDEYDAHLRARVFINYLVDDLLVVVGEHPLDDFVASSGLILVRSGSRLPVVSSLVLDLDALSDNSTEEIYHIMLHELAHCLGFGMVWNDLGLLSDRGGLHFTGRNARQVFNGTATWYKGASVPVQYDRGHWRTSIFGDALMAQGWVFPYRQRLSTITLAQFDDLGYEVQWMAADVYTVPRPESAKAHVEGEPIRCDLFRGPVRAVDEDGRVVR